MRLFSQLPLGTIFFKHWIHDQGEAGIAIAKQCFLRGRAGAPMIPCDAPDLQFEDRFHGEPGWSHLEQEQDIAPCKVGTDLTIRAIARSPEARALPYWPAGVRVTGRHDYGFEVRGPSVWTHRRFSGWRRLAPAPVTEVPITYALAFGGRAPGSGTTEVVYEANPSGIGLATPELLTRRLDIPVPQIGLARDFLTSDPLAKMEVAGFGPIAKTWLPRRRLAGTFDERWQQDRHPRMPLDYSFRFWNHAPERLQFDPPLHGNEEITVYGISHRPEPIKVTLPGVVCLLKLEGATRASLPMVLDTVALDLEDENDEAHKVTLIWRVQIDAPDRFETGEILQRLEK